MSKFLLNLLLQISKALVNSKIQFLIQKFFFLTFGPADLAAHSAFGPARLLTSLPPQAETAPAGPPSPHVGRVFTGIRFPFWFAPSELPPLPRLSVKRAPAVSSVPHLQPPEFTRAATASRPPSAAELRASGATEPLPPRLHFPSFNSPLKPSSVFNGVKAINAGVNPLATPPRRSPDPDKRRAPPPEFTAPLPASLRFSPCLSLPLTERRRLQFCTAIARPPCRRLSSGEAPAELPMLSSLYCAPAGELWCTGAAGGRTPVSAPPRSGTLCLRRRWSTVDRARPAGPRPLPLENNSLIKISGNFARKPLCFHEINSRSSFCRFCT
jgi:hypothetical protein